jgi:hypothetical protein
MEDIRYNTERRGGNSEFLHLSDQKGEMGDLTLDGERYLRWVYKAPSRHVMAPFSLWLSPFFSSFFFRSPTLHSEFPMRSIPFEGPVLREMHSVAPLARERGLRLWF